MCMAAASPIVKYPDKYVIIQVVFPFMLKKREGEGAVFLEAVWFSCATS